MPNIPIFMTFGNNDCHYHDNAPPTDEKADFYSFIWNLWFVNHPANLPFATESAQQTFMDGGYFRADVSNGVAVLSVNTLEYNLGQNSVWIGPEAENQFQWLESNLNNTEDATKFLIITHIYAGGRISHNTKN